MSEDLDRAAPRLQAAGHEPPGQVPDQAPGHASNQGGSQAAGQEARDYPAPGRREGAPNHATVHALDHATGHAPNRAASQPARDPAAPDEAATLAALRRLRPDLVDRYLEAATAARTAVLARLWGAFAREPIAGLRHKQTSDGRLTITLDDGRQLSGPEAAARMFAQPDELSVTFDGVEYDHPARLLEALPLPGARARLVRELDNSVANLALARANARRLPVHDLVDAEQALVDGHPLHPCCRTRIGMSTEDVLTYAPEHHPVVRLHLVEVDPEHWHTTGVPKPPLLPVHPWQLDRVLASGVARDTGTTLSARPLMSLRTLATPEFHLKTAVDVQMTSAVRTLSPATVHNGPLATALLKRLAPKGLTILGEPSGASIVLGGEHQRSMACVWREAPQTQPQAQRRPIVPLAALESLTDDLIKILLPPLLTMLRLGVALEAHGQNTLVAFEDGRPVEIFYRDVGGIHVSPRRLARAGLEMPPLTGTVPADDPEALRTKLFAAVFNCVPIEPRQWDTIAAVVRSSASNEDRAALEADTLPLKATTAMRLADDPLRDQWARIPNPMQR